MEQVFSWTFYPKTLNESKDNQNLEYSSFHTGRYLSMTKQFASSLGYNCTFNLLYDILIWFLVVIWTSA